MDLHGFLAQSLDLAQLFEGAWRAAGQFDRLAVGAQHVVRQAVAVRSFTPPLHDAGVAGRLDLVQLAHQLGKCGVGGTGRRRGTGGGVRQRWQLRSRRRAVEHAGLQVHRAAHGAVMAEKVRLCPQHFAIGQVATQRAVVEETGARIQRHCDDADFSHGCAHCARRQRRQVLHSPRVFIRRVSSFAASIFVRVDFCPRRFLSASIFVRDRGVAPNLLTLRGPAGQAGRVAPPSPVRLSRPAGCAPPGRLVARRRFCLGAVSGFPLSIQAASASFQGNGSTGI